MKVCKECKSENVFYDAYVNVNYPSDIHTFDTIYCNDCEGETSLEVKND